MKVTVLGAAGSIGQALSLLLKMKLPDNSHLSLYDISPVTPGIALDLSHIPTSVKTEGFDGTQTKEALSNTNIVLISAGFARKPGMDRSDLFKLNAKIIQHLIEEVAEYSPNALIGIITNPVNSMVPVAASVLKKAGVYNKNKLFGITTLDIIRSNAFIAKLKQKNPTKINTPVIGGHSGITILPLLSQLTKDYCFSEKEIVDLTKKVQTAGNAVLEAKAGGGSATLAMSAAATRFTLSLIRGLEGEKNIIEYAYVEGNTTYATFFSQPLLFGRDGIIEYLSIGNLSQFEQNTISNMIKTLNNDICIGEEFIK
ncbi:malate dehydrogenase [Candidatus Erwinia haradaeae]|uniref:Malate dehydrogenase n=1 Tax=Candidatus Erwinia haradaeae TaxID=1922217 RepID=A0A803FUB4_9GAMM|nr:malate dehydrogenase [Candidatus Erwinia haradaeae]VFP88664.1 Malate dehydrogenase [Candidatus Erwinia haradaeae]